MGGTLTSLTLLTAVVVAYGVFGAKGYPRALAIGGATPMGAAAIFGAVVVPTFYAVAIGAAVGVAFRFLQRGREPEAELVPIPGARPLVLLVAVAVLVTLLAPMFFNGLSVLSPLGDVQLSAGLLTKSNVAQVAYLVLSVSVVVYLARSPHAGPDVVGVAVCTTTVLSFWSWTHGQFGVPFPEGLFDNSPAFTIQDRLPNGLPRVRGILPEPSALGASCLMTMAYGIARVPALNGARRLLMVVVVGMATYLGFICTSATFFVAGAATGCLAGAVALGAFLLRGRRVSRAAAAVLCCAAICALWALPWAADLLDSVIGEKVGSSSYTERSSADAKSLKIVWDTYGFGVGLGSNRASSFAASLLSTVGVLGALLLVIGLWVVVRESWSERRYRPVVWTMVALLTAKVIAGPDLNDPSGVLWTGTGVLAHAALLRHRAFIRARRPASRSVSGTLDRPSGAPHALPGAVVDTPHAAEVARG